MYVQHKIPFLNIMLKMYTVLLIFVLLPKIFGEKITADNVPPYIKQCYQEDQEVIKCFISALEHLRPYLAEGINEIELPSVEPFKMDELSLSLTGGPNGYKISLHDMNIYGASNFTVQKMKLSECDDEPFEAVIKIPLMRIRARYQSSGVLIIIPASGNGTFLGQFHDVTCKLKGKASTHCRDGEKFLHVDSLNVAVDIKQAKMMVKNIYRNNKILEQAINLFLRDNSIEVFKIMNKQLNKKLAMVFMNISNKLLTYVPIDAFYVPKN